MRVDVIIRRVELRDQLLAALELRLHLATRSAECGRTLFVDLGLDRGEVPRGDLVLHDTRM